MKVKSAQIHRSCLEDLKRLKDLLENGVLTEDEFIYGREMANFGHLERLEINYEEF